MKFERFEVDNGLYQETMIQFMALAYNIDGRTPYDVKKDLSPPKLKSIYLSLHVILSGLINAGFYSSDEIADDLEELAKNTRVVEGPKR